MDLPLENLQREALLENSEECNALRSLLLGLCQQCSVFLQKANSYQELILDELDARRGNTAYMDKVQKELSTIQTLVAQILQELPPVQGDRLNLSRLLQGVLDRFRKEMPPERLLETDLNENAYIAADAFEFQALLLDLLMGLERLDKLNALQVKGWKINLSTHSFPRQEASILHLKDGGEYCILSIRPSDAPELDFTNLCPFAQCLEETGMIPAMVVAQWCGSAAHNGASLFFDGTLPLQSAVLILPLMTASAAPSSAPDFTAYRQTISDDAKTILLVDDEDMIWDVLSDMLQELGYRVLLAGDGKEAVEIFRENPGQIDLVILDMLMPNMGGRETFFLLKKLDPKVRVLASSGYVSQEEIQDVMDAGAAGFLRKPYRMAELARKIREIFEK